MKRILLIVLIATCAGLSFAALWEEDFSTAPGMTSDGTAQIPSERTGTDWWYYLSADASSGAMVVSGRDDLANRGASKVWSGAANLASGTYTLTFDVATLSNSNNRDFNFAIYDAVRTGGGYEIIMGGASTVTPGVNSLGGVVSLLDSQVVDGTQGTGASDVVSLDFTHDGTKDLVFFSSVTGYTWNNNIAYSIDNMSVVPEPATLGLLGLGGLVALGVRRFRAF